MSSPIGVLAALALLAFFLWRRRRRRREELALRKEEADQYSYHPNEDSRDGTAAIAGTTQDPRSARFAPYRGWQPTVPLTKTVSSTPVVTRTHGQDLHRQTDSAFEAPTLPVFASPGIEEQDTRAFGDSNQRTAFPPRNQTSPGNGSPPLNAIGIADVGNNPVPDTPSGEREARGTTSNRAPYPVSGMSALMPPLQRGSQRVPNLQTGLPTEDSRRFSYSDF